MKELSTHQTHEVNGASVYDDLKSFMDSGLTHREITFGVVTWSAGIVIGSMLPTVLVPFASLGAVAGWVIYDWQANA